ncbi:hypothetical protein DMUE_5102 [Dictyocoela muelleri]|nr:hypothetical protein DMUE_5102 [Dictyocoela muelleri]
MYPLNINTLRSNKLNCRYLFFMFSSPLLYQRKVNIEIIYTLIHYLLRNLNIEQIAMITNKSNYFIREITWTLSCKFRQRFNDKSFRIGGINIIVEADESKFGNRKNNIGEIVDGVCVFEMVERTIERKIFLIEIDDKKAITLISTIDKKVEFGPTIYTDGLRSYNAINDEVYEHESVNHNENFIDPISVHTQTIEANWSAIKRTVPMQSRSEEKVEIYLVRFMMIRNLGIDLYDEVIKETFY